MKNNSLIKIIIADDHPIFRRGLRGVIESEENIEILAEADNGTLALRLIEEFAPDVAVLDLDMPEKDGFEVARAALEKNSPVEIIFLTMHNNESVFNAALDLGVKGYVIKDSALPEIIDGIRAVARGENYISPQLSTLLIKRAAVSSGNRIKNSDRLQSLTHAERRILKLIADEKTSRQIASELFISVRTVDRHRANICDKLDLRGTNALIKFAFANRSEFE